MNLINWLRQPNVTGCGLILVKINMKDLSWNSELYATQKHADDFVAWQIEQFSGPEGYDMVKVKTDLNELTDSFLQKFLYDAYDPREQIISFQRYRGKKEIVILRPHIYLR